MLPPVPLLMYFLTSLPHCLLTSSSLNPVLSYRFADPRPLTLFESYRFKNNGEEVGSPELVCIFRRPSPFKHHSRKHIAHDYERNHENRYRQLVAHQIRHRIRSITDRQVPDSKVSEQSRNRNRRCVTEQRHLKHARCQHEKFERRRRRQERRNQHSDEPVLFHPMSNGVRMLPGLPVKKRFPALSRNE